MEGGLHLLFSSAFTVVKKELTKNATLEREKNLVKNKKYKTLIIKLRLTTTIIIINKYVWKN